MQARGLDGCGQRVVLGEERGQIRPQRDARGARQRGDVDQKVGLFLIGERQRVGQHQPPLGVGVADFDGHAGARADDIARPVPAAGPIAFSAMARSGPEPDLKPRRP